MSYTLEFYFAGTGGSAQNMRSYFKQNYSSMENDGKTLRIFFSGCQHNSIGGKSLFLGYISPDLSAVVDRIYQCFRRYEKFFFDVHLLKSHFKKSILFDDNAFFYLQRSIKGDLHSLEVSKIFLYGFSRGAVTAFMVAKRLNCLQIDMNIYAEEPIPGETKSYYKRYIEPGDNVYNPYQLQTCHYIKKATIFLGDHSRDEVLGIWYRKILPIFHDSTEVLTYLLPTRYHLCFGLFTQERFACIWSIENSKKIDTYDYFYNYVAFLGLEDLCQHLYLPTDNEKNGCRNNGC